MKIPIMYNARSVLQRPASTAFTALGIGLVVAVFIGMLALANGFRTALARTGSPDNVLVLRKGAGAEMNSAIDRATASLISASPHVRKGADGRPLVSPEVFVVISAPRIGEDGRPDSSALANVVVRGISDKAWEVRHNVAVTAGRKPQSGRSEVCVGAKIAGRFAGAKLNDRMRFGGRDWEVVCEFTAGGSAFESEVWGENEQLMPVFRGQVFQSLSFRLADPSSFAEAKRALEADKQMTVEAHRESDFYVEQSAILGSILEILAILITSIMAVGAIFGAVNTMYAAVSGRSPEIAVLLTLGFHPRSVLASFVAESAIIAAIGGVIGCLIALPVNGVVANTTNWASFSEIAFSFRVTPGLLLAGFLFAVVMGVLGGFFPARRAARMEVVSALR
ncbi:MAG TPA: FtsX-like permease family protein [Gemmatimonadaceae bacterium]|nr:FtsX-like permease family protein [Gemmatimonadaceae bacterium]